MLLTTLYEKLYPMSILAGDSENNKFKVVMSKEDFDEFIVDMKTMVEIDTDESEDNFEEAIKLVKNE